MQKNILRDSNNDRKPTAANSLAHYTDFLHRLLGHYYMECGMKKDQTKRIKEALTASLKLAYESNRPLLAAHIKKLLEELDK